MTERVHVLLFDVDGTLLLSGGAGRRALDGAFEELFGVPEAMKGISPNGLTDSIICREMFRTRLKREGTGEECGRLLSRYAGLLGQAVDESEGFTLMPGIPALLEALSSRPDVMLGLGTGNIEQGARIKLGRAGLNRYFSFGGFGCDAAERAPLIEAGFRRGEKMAEKTHPGAEAVRWVIGDTRHDVEAGRACGARVVAVATGGVGREALAAAKPDYLFADFSEPDGFMSMLDEAGPRPGAPPALPDR
jgi:phosphoglycolate phosphatase-like HAD superfamily hydrolase